MTDPRTTSKKNAAINRIAQGSAMFNGMNARDRGTLRALLAVAYTSGKTDAREAVSPLDPSHDDRVRIEVLEDLARDWDDSYYSELLRTHAATFRAKPVEDAPEIFPGTRDALDRLTIIGKPVTS